MGIIDDIYYTLVKNGTVTSDPPYVESYAAAGQNLRVNMKYSLPEDEWFLGFKIKWWKNYGESDQALLLDGEMTDTYANQGAKHLEGATGTKYKGYGSALLDSTQLSPGDKITAQVWTFTIDESGGNVYYMGGDYYMNVDKNDGSTYAEKLSDWDSFRTTYGYKNIGGMKWYNNASLRGDSAITFAKVTQDPANLMSVLNSMITAYGSNTDSRRQVDLSTTLTVEPPDDIKRVESDCSAEAADTADVSETATSVKVYQIFKPQALSYLNQALNLVYTPNPASSSGVLFYSYLVTSDDWAAGLQGRIDRNENEPPNDVTYDSATFIGGYDWFYDADDNTVKFGYVDSDLDTTSRYVALVYSTTDSSAVNAIGGSTWNADDEQLEPAMLPMVPTEY
jgi:hypothetical protein